MNAAMMIAALATKRPITTGSRRPLPRNSLPPISSAAGATDRGGALCANEAAGDIAIAAATKYLRLIRNLSR